MAKSGGLGDVAAALPVALRTRGVDVQLMMPAYRCAMPHVRQVTVVAECDDLAGLGPAALLAAKTVTGGTPIWLVRSKKMFDRSGDAYADAKGKQWPDNHQRFALLCHAAAWLIGLEARWKPSIVHANDWPAGLIPTLLRAGPSRRPACLLTIHNAAYQARSSSHELRTLGIAVQTLRSNAARSFLGLGVRDTDLLNAVSPTYAREVQTRHFGAGLERLFSARARALSGILNGVDYSIWDPRHDQYIEQRYDERSLERKARCKAALLAEMRLENASCAPILGIVSRLVSQKGLDLFLEVADTFTQQGARVVLLGRGDPPLERAFRALARRHPKRVAVCVGFNEGLAHRIIAGSDIFVMPSRFEPSGLSQMYGLRYGTIPVVSPVGGLVDSVWDEGSNGILAGTTTGFVMRRVGAAPLKAALRRALSLYWHTSVWRRLQRNAMRQDFSWDVAASKYQALYRQLLGKRGSQ